MDSNNFYKITGVIYAKPTKTVQGVKDPSKSYDFSSIILEVKRDYKEKTYTELPEFELGKGVSLVDFEIGDKVEISFALAGKKVTETFHKTTAKAIYIKHADIQTNDLREIGGKSPQEIRREEKAEKELFTGDTGDDKDELSDLPF